MFARKTLISIFLLLFLVGPAFGSVVGTWSIKGTVNVKATVTGYAPRSASGRARDRFTFHEDGSFTQLSGVAGSWRQNGQRFTVKLDGDDIRSLLYSVAGAFGVRVSSVEVRKADIVGTESRNGVRIVGALKLKLRGLGVNVRGRKATVNVNSTSNFTGKRISGAAASAGGLAGQHTDLLKHILRSVAEEADAIH